MVKGYRKKICPRGKFISDSIASLQVTYVYAIKMKEDLWKQRCMNVFNFVWET